MKYTYLLFDFDGTLVDTNELILQSFEHTLQYFFADRYSRADVLPHMGKPLSEQFAIWAEHEDQISHMIEVYRKHNIENHDRLVEIFPNVQETLTRLRSEGCKLAVVTSKMRLTARMGLRLFGLAPIMDAVITLEDTEQHKPKPEPVLLAMEKLQATPEKTLMIGDSPWDLLSGQAAGVDSCGVAWSLRGKEGLRPYQPTYLIENMSELLTIVRR